MEESFPEEIGPLHIAAPEILSRLLASEGEVAEIFAEHTYRERFTLRYDRWRAYREPWEDYATDLVKGTGLRVVRNGSSRHGSLEGYDPKVVRIEAEGLRGGEPADVKVNRLAPVGSLALPPDIVNRVTLEEKRSLLQAAVDAALSLEPRLRDLEVDMQGVTRQIYVASTVDHPTFSASSLVGMRVQGSFERGDRRLDVYAIGGGTGGVGQFMLDPPDELARTCVERLQSALSAQTLTEPLSAVPVVIEGGWGGVWLHEAVGHLLEADTAGPYTKERIGSRVAPEDVTVVDDGTYKNGRGTALYDDEGHPSQRTVLVEDGILRRLITDRRQAQRLGLPRTGNGRRQDYRSEPMARMTNLLLEGGTTAPGDLIAGVDKGFYVRTIGSGKVYPSEDTFTFHVVEGALIEGGQLTTPISGVQVTGRPSELLESIAGLGNDFRIDRARGTCKKDGQAVPVSVGIPTVLLRNLKVSPVL